MRRLILIALIALSFTMPAILTAPANQQANAQSTESVTRLCTGTGIQPRGATFAPGGIILTYFDRHNLWVYDIDRNARYPLPDTTPCGTNCHLSQDARWITYLDATSNAFGKMRLDGTQRTLLATYAAEVQWWDTETLLIWTPGHDAYLRPETGEIITPLDVNGVTNIQPGGTLATRIELDDDQFVRWLVDLDNTERVPMRLGPDEPYFNATAWSPDGGWLAYVAPGDYDPDSARRGAEIYAIRPDDIAPMRWTWLSQSYGSVRINGHTSGELSWSPDGTRIAFWVMELFSPDPTANLGTAMIHVLDVDTREVTAYCGFSTIEHTPNPPRLIWSPDSTHLAFGGNIPADDKGYLLLTLSIADGTFTELSSGIYPAFGTADVVAWGLRP